MIRVLIADDQNLVRQGLITLLSLEADLEIVGEAANGLEAINEVSRLSPQVVLMDIRMPVCDGVRATQEILSRTPSVKVIMLTTFDDDEYISKALQAGASGYLLKDVPSEQIAQAVRGVLGGMVQLNSSVAGKLLSRVKPPGSQQEQKLLDQLTERERQVLSLIGKGRSNKEIAEELCLTEGTVKNYVTNILTHLSARDRTQAAIWAQQYLS